MPCQVEVGELLRNVVVNQCLALSNAGENVFWQIRCGAAFIHASAPVRFLVVDHQVLAQPLINGLCEQSFIEINEQII